MFKNPLASYDSPDPFMTFDIITGFYYAMFTCRKNIILYRSKYAGEILSKGEKKVVLCSQPENKLYGNFWAPEMHKAPNGKWYIYSSSSHSLEDWQMPWGGIKNLFVLESETQDPFDGFHFKSWLDDRMYAIDPTIYTDKENKQYICYSLCSDKQVLEIREMLTPYSLGEKRAIISQPEFAWEKMPPTNTWTINEGAFFLKNKDKLYIMYSYNGAFLDDYGIAMLEYIGGNLCNNNSWKKKDKPFFTKGNGVYGPGHASFFRSPDGSEIWIAYHGMNHSNRNEKYTPRYMNIQKLFTNENVSFIETHPVGNNYNNIAPRGEK